VPLHVLASSQGDKNAAVKALLRAWPQAVSAPDRDGCTPLHRAVGAAGMLSLSCLECVKMMLRTKTAEAPVQRLDARGDSVLGCLVRAMISDETLDHFESLDPAEHGALFERERELLVLVICAWPCALFTAAHSGLEPLQLLLPALQRRAEDASHLTHLTRQVGVIVIAMSFELQRDSALAERGLARCSALQRSFAGAPAQLSPTREWGLLTAQIDMVVVALDCLALEHRLAEEMRSKILSEDATRLAAQEAAPPRARAAKSRAKARAATGEEAGENTGDVTGVHEADKAAARASARKARRAPVASVELAPTPDELPPQDIPPTPDTTAKHMSKLRERLHAKSALVVDLTARNGELLALTEALQARVCALETSLTQQMLLHRYHSSNVLS